MNREWWREQVGLKVWPMLAWITDVNWLWRWVLENFMCIKLALYWISGSACVFLMEDICSSKEWMYLLFCRPPVTDGSAAQRQFSSHEHRKRSRWGLALLVWLSWLLSELCYDCCYVANFVQNLWFLASEDVWLSAPSTQTVKSTITSLCAVCRVNTVIIFMTSESRAWPET